MLLPEEGAATLALQKQQEEPRDAEHPSSEHAEKTEKAVEAASADAPVAPELKTSLEKKKEEKRVC